MNSYKVGDKVEIRNHNGIITEVKLGWTSVNGEYFTYSNPHYIVTCSDGHTEECAQVLSLKPVTRTDEELAELRNKYLRIAKQSEDVSPEAANAAAKMKPTRKVITESFDFELGWVIDKLPEHNEE